MLKLPLIEVLKLRLLFATLLLAIALTFVLVGYLPALNGALLVIFGAGLFLLSQDDNKRVFVKWGVFIPTVILGFFVAIYRPPEFSYPLIYHADSLHEGGKPFSLFVNVSKAIGGYLVLLCLFSEKTGAWWKVFSRNTALYIAGGTLIVILSAILFGVSWAPKLNDAIPYFIAVNLFVTVVSEEAFFRILLYDRIVKFFKKQSVGLVVGVTITTLLFTVSHTAALGPMFILFLIAGATYALVYAITKNFFASVLVHFGVNIFHFVLLEYPL